MSLNFLQLVYTCCFCLALSVRPYIIPFAFDGDANSGDTAQLTCHVSKGDRPFTLTWSFQGRDISPQSGVATTMIGDSISVLVISAATDSHRGNYTCTAKNRAGRTNHTATIRVNGIILCWT